MLSGGLFVCGTASDSGKSTVVAGLCRVLARRGLRVAPFKAQNMALNSAVTASGHEIGRAQAAQAAAAGVEAEVAMNPILLKPTGERTSQVVVNGRPWATLDAASYHRVREELWPVVTSSLEDLRRRYDAVICEGAGSPAEINLLDSDITNLRVAHAAGLPSVLVGDIDRGGVFAALAGTVSLLPGGLRSTLRGFIINKFRGDPSLLSTGLAEIERRTGLPCLGVVPWIDGIAIDAEDSLALRRFGSGRRAAAGGLDVAAVALPRISNFTDLDALIAEPGVSVRLVDDPRALGRPDLVVVPGTKATVADLAWLKDRGLDSAIRAVAGDSTVLGICGGYQMLGRHIDDRFEAETPAAVDGLGLLQARTFFREKKTVRRVDGCALGCPVEGYEIHHGVTVADRPWLHLGAGPEGSSSPDGAVFGTSVHGLFEGDRFRRRFLGMVARRSSPAWQPGPEVSFAAARRRQHDALADALEAHLDLPAVLGLIGAR